MKVTSIVLVMVMGVFMAVRSFEEPMGSVTNSFCGSPDRHCNTYTYEVKHD